MKKKLFYFFVLIFLFYSNIAKPQSDDRWVYIASNGEVTWYYDSKTLKNVNGTYVVWLKRIFISEYYYDDKLVDYAIQKSHYICNQYKTIGEDITFYFKSGDYLSIEDENIEQDVQPDTIGEYIYNLFCKGE
jgi:hypothetical protein